MPYFVLNSSQVFAHQTARESAEIVHPGGIRRSLLSNASMQKGGEGGRNRRILWYMYTPRVYYYQRSTTVYVHVIVSSSNPFSHQLEL